jgi:type II secretory pathway component GspD/PulD (secretin)
MLTSHAGACGALACLTAAFALVCPQAPTPDLSVTRLSGDTAPQPPRPAPPQPARVPGLPITQLDDRMRSADLDAPQRLTLSFSEPAAVRDVLLLLVRGTPLSIAVDPAVTATFVGELKDVTLRRAIDAVLAPSGLAYDVDGSVIRVFPRRTETRFYDLNFLNVERTWQRTLHADDTDFTARAPVGDALADAAGGVQTLLSANGRVHVDRRAGLAQVTDDPDRLDRVGAYLETLHARGLRQVRLQVRVLEVTMKGAASIDWRTVRSRLGLPDKSVTAGIVVDAAALQTVLASQGEVALVTAPELVATNNEPAVIRTSTANASALILTVVPQVSSDGLVLLNVSPSWTSRAGGGTTGTASIDEADTVVRVMDGSTVMVSGFLHPDDQTNAASGLAGGFGAQQQQRRTKEIVVLLTPSVVNAAAGAPAAR